MLPQLFCFSHELHEYHELKNYMNKPFIFKFLFPKVNNNTNRNLKL